MTSHKSDRNARLGALLFVLGLLLTAVMSFIFFWPDMEASLFDTNSIAEANGRARALRCPYVITPAEVAEIQASFKNPLDREITFLVRSRISQGYVTLMRQESELVRIPPGEELTLMWPVAAGDAAYGRVIMARILTTRSAAAPSQHDFCGILLLNVPGLTGGQIVTPGLILVVLLLGGGAWLWWGKRPLNDYQRRFVVPFALLALTLLASLVAGLLNAWLFGLVLLVATLVLVGIILERFAHH